MHVLNNVRRLAAVYQRHRTQWRTERIIGRLPAEIRKDIGWPDSIDERIRPRRSAEASI